jgi:hypothetical protein
MYTLKLIISNQVPIYKIYYDIYTHYNCTHIIKIYNVSLI